MYKKYLIFTIICICMSCTNQPINLGKYKLETLNIATNANENLLDTCDVDVDYVASLQLPDGYADVLASKFVYEKGHFIIMDEDKYNTVFVFDSIGNYISKLGTRGHAKNEYVRGPSDFFVDDIGEKIHVYDKHSRRILIYSMSGTYVNGINLESFPYSICLSKNNNYFCAFNHKFAKNGLQLALLSPKEEILDKYLNLEENQSFVSNYNAFNKVDSKIYYVPNLADSVFVFANDTLNKIVKLNFDCEFISQDIRSDALQEELEEYHKFNGVNHVSCYYETEHYILVGFSKSILCMYSLIDKHSGKNYCFTSNPLSGFFPSQEFYIHKDKMYYLITKDNVNVIKDTTSKADLEKLLKDSPRVIRDVFNGKYELPLVVSIKIK